MVNKKQTQSAALVLSFAAAYCGLGCLMTGMGFSNIPMFYVGAACALSAAVTAFTADRKWFIAIPAAFVFLCLRLWQKGSLELSLEAFLHCISNQYHFGYGWGVIRWSGETLRPDMASLALCLLGAFLAMGICHSFLKSRGVFFPLLLTCLPVIPCMLLTNTVPESRYLFGTLACTVLLLLVRLSKKQGKGIGLMGLLALPVAVSVVILFACMPQKDYTALQPMEDLLAYVQGFFAEGEGPDAPQAPVREEGSWVNLNAVGPKKHRRGIVMEVKASQSGYLYLRGAAFDTYYGTWWDCVKTAPVVYLPPTGALQSVEITTRALHDTLYLPYGVNGIGSGNFPISEEKGQVPNGNHWRSYTVKYRDLPDYGSGWELPSADAPAVYTQLPQATRREAERYLTQHLPQLADMGVWEKANAIVDHVSRSAVYSLKTPKMPAGTKDFALWFLEESESGYCIHFATAAAVLLRAAGIPCRYMTGYLVYATPGMVEVEQHNAHAWVECYIDDVGWVPLEPTPGGGIAQTVDRETTPTQTEAQTQDPTETTTETEAQTETNAPAVETMLPPAMETTAPSGSTSPIGGADGPSQPNTPGKTDMPWLPWILHSLLTVVAVTGQWRLRVLLRRRKRRCGKKSAQALARWQEVRLYCRVRKEPPSQRLLELAQKAKFSHHAITREELAEFDTWLNASETILRHSNLWKQFLATIFYALF